MCAWRRVVPIVVKDREGSVGCCVDVWNWPKGHAHVEVKAKFDSGSSTLLGRNCGEMVDTKKVP